MDKVIDNKLWEDNYNYLIKDTLLPGENPNITNQLNDISVLEKSHGKLRFEKHEKKEPTIKVGDTVVNKGVRAKVLDIDEKLLCCQNYDTGTIIVWSIDEVKKL